MKMTWWKWALVAVLGIPLALLLVVASLHQPRETPAPSYLGADESAFGPKAIWEASSPFSGLLPSRPQAHRAIKTMGVSLSEEAVSLHAPPPQAPSAQAPSLEALKLIRTGEVRIEVKNFDAAAMAVAKLAMAAGGYVSSTHVNRRPSGHLEGTVIVRIPAPKFDATGAAVGGLGKVVNQMTNVQDVTQAYTDLEAELRVKRDAAGRIREILRTRTGKLEEVLAAEKELARITEEIETAEGRRQYFDHQIRLSTLTVGLFEPEPMVVMSEPGSWSALGEAVRDSSAMVAGTLAVMFRLFLIFAPWALLLTGVWKLVSRVRRRKAASL